MGTLTAAKLEGKVQQAKKCSVGAKEGGETRKQRTPARSYYKNKRGHSPEGLLLTRSFEGGGSTGRSDGCLRRCTGAVGETPPKVAGDAPLVGDVPRKAEGWKSSGGSKALWRKKMKEKRRGNDLRSGNEEEGKVMGDSIDGIGGMDG